ncbi:MAG: hypothetical protein LBR06_03125 [Bacteroidales bacterium]|jgi:MraZ protein|nr:hypothetical protein [Bacteroidales bacterium]
MKILCGDKNATVDEKGRVVLPAEFRQAMGGVPDGILVVEKNPHLTCLNLYPSESWEPYFTAIDRRLRRTDRDQARLRTMFYASFKEIEVPATGRINLPPTFLKAKNIDKEVVFVGQGRFLQLWNAAEYNALINPTADNEQTYSELYQEFLSDIDPDRGEEEANL